MNKQLATLALLSALVVLAAFALPAGAATASEAQWIAAASDAVAFGRLQGMPIDLEVERGAGLAGHAPIGLWSARRRLDRPAENMVRTARAHRGSIRRHHRGGLAGALPSAAVLRCHE
jgi:hypothetical protein